MANTLLTIGDFNVIAVDWGSLAGTRPLHYAKAAKNTKTVASSVSRLLEFMVEKYSSGILSNVHLIGHSLGAHVCGMAGKSFSDPKLARITGLDPARPLFLYTYEERRLSPNDADFVDVIHSDAYGNDINIDGNIDFGLFMPVGHADFYPNGGDNQPGCTKKSYIFGLLKTDSCSHSRARELFEASIKYSYAFNAKECDSLNDLKKERCSDCGTTLCNKMGYFATKPTSLALYYLETTSTKPYYEDGEWLDWTAWSDCPVPCGGGIQTRTRTCDGMGCIGDGQSSQYCNINACQDNVDWSCPDGSNHTVFCKPMPPNIANPCILDDGEECYQMDPHISRCCKKRTCLENCGIEITERGCSCEDVCTDNGDCCPEYANDCTVPVPCNGLGDPHFLTLDGRHYDYQGACEYTLLTTDCPGQSLDHFSVFVTTEYLNNNYDVSWTREGRVLVYDQEIKLLQGKYVLLNNTEVRPPVQVTPHLRITLAGWWLVITTGYGLSIEWDGVSSLQVQVSDALMGKVCGLSGNFNGDPDDDFLTSYGYVTSDVNEFGDSWAAIDGCAPAKRSLHEQSRRDLNYDLPTQICTDLFNSENIPTCILDATTFMAACVLDLSATLPDNDTSGGCAMVASYVGQCIAKGADIGDWRFNTECEIQCPYGQSYYICGPSCPRTCREPFPVGTCNNDCIEGCFCDEDQVLDDDGICVDQSECGCYYQGILYKFGEEMPNGEICNCNIPNTICIGCRHFEIHTDEVTWQTAHSTCDNMGGRLAMLETETINEKVSQYIRDNNFQNDVKKGFWFGLNDIDDEGSFVWSDGTPLNITDFEMWAKKEPNNKTKKDSSGQDCVQLWKKKNLSWDDDYCGDETSKKKGYICEFTDLCP